MRIDREYWLEPCGRDRPTFVIAGDDDPETDEVKLIFMESPLFTEIHVTLDTLHDIRTTIEQVLDDLDERRRCPSCGYTKDDAVIHSDHTLCRQYPYFEFERPDLPASEVDGGPKRVSKG